VSLDPLHRWEQRLGALPMPSPLVWVVLVAAFLGFGVLLGRATGSDSVAALAASRAPLKVLVARAPVPTPGTTTPATPPAAPEAETTPAPTGSSEEANQSPAGGASSSGASSSSKGSSGGRSGGGSGGGEGAGAGKSTSSGSGPSAPAKATLSAIKHVFVVMLDGESYATAFGDTSPAHYLTGTLERQGKLLVRYYAVAHAGLADGIALLSGQGPTEATAADCPTYSEISPASAGLDGQVLGKGCVYPSSTQTLISQLVAKHLTWRAYIEGIDEGASTPPACARPAAGAPDPSASLTAGATAPSYQTWRNPFAYFGAIAGSFSCSAHDVGMGELSGDLASEPRTASFSYIAPGPCDDGSSTPCAPAKAAGMGAADAFLHKYVPKILSSNAYKKDGLLVITSDNAPASGEYADSSSCCGQPAFPNLPAPTTAGHGGGQVGLLLLSPFLKKGGGFAQETYNHYSLLATIERIFGLGKLGYAALPEAKPFSASLFSGG
jgi:phosphatidylinositol-3-phosphatase